MGLSIAGKGATDFERRRRAKGDQPRLATPQAPRVPPSRRTTGDQSPGYDHLALGGESTALVPRRGRVPTLRTVSLWRGNRRRAVLQRGERIPGHFHDGTDQDASSKILNSLMGGVREGVPRVGAELKRHPY